MLKSWPLYVRLLALFIVASQLGACAVMSKQDCLTADWQDVGYKVGADGRTDIAGTFSKRANICAKHGAQADLVAYEVGHAQGIVDFCDISNAVQLGVSGTSRAINDQVCPEYEYPGFAEAFYAGYRLHELRTAANQAQYEVDRLDDIEHRNRRTRESLRRQLNSADVSDEEKQSIRRRINRLRYEIRDVNDRKRHYRNRAYEHQRAASNYENLLDIEYGDGIPGGRR